MRDASYMLSCYRRRLLDYCNNNNNALRYWLISWSPVYGQIQSEKHTNNNHSSCIFTLGCISYHFPPYCATAVNNKKSVSRLSSKIVASRKQESLYSGSRKNHQLFLFAYLPRLNLGRKTKRFLSVSSVHLKFETCCVTALSVGHYYSFISSHFLHNRRQLLFTAVTNSSDKKNVSRLIYTTTNKKIMDSLKEKYNRDPTDAEKEHTRSYEVKKNKNKRE